MTIRVELTFNRLSTFGKTCNQIAFHQTKPMPVDFDFLLSINRRYGILTVLDSGERCFNNQITHARGILPPGQLTLINLYIDVQIVVANQHCRRCCRQTPSCSRRARAGSAL